MNLSTIYRPLEVTLPRARAVRRHKDNAHREPLPPSPISGLTDLQRRLVMLHVAQATPTRPSDERPSWPGIALVCSLCFAALAVATGAWQ
jgi:hypothetical protein